MVIPAPIIPLNKTLTTGDVKEKILSLRANKSGLCHGVIQWLGLQIFKEVKYENRPGEIRSHWPTPIYRFNEPLYVVKGQEITIYKTVELGGLVEVRGVPRDNDIVVDKSVYINFDVANSNIEATVDTRITGS